MPSLSGYFLVAKATLKDPNFAQSVILLLEHNDEGAFGVIVNKPLEMKDLPFAVYDGGPCPSQGLLLIHGQEAWVASNSSSDSREIMPGAYFGDATCLSKLKDEEPSSNLRVRVFTGYSGWAPDQLEGELATNSWAVVKADAETLFETPAEELWEKLIPPAIPPFSLN